MAIVGERVRCFVAPSDESYRPPAFHGFPTTLPTVESDGLVTLKIRPHSLAKLEAVGRYCNAFARALKRRWATTYVDLYAGPGVLELEGGKLTWGSPMIALQCADPFNSLVLVEMQPQRANVLLQRARRIARRGEEVCIIQGEAEKTLDDVLRRIPVGSVALTLIDPFRLEFSLEAMATLAGSGKKMDLILLFAEGMDLRRNLQNAIRSAPGSDRFDKVFGGPEWRDLVQPKNPPARNAVLLRKLYLDRLRRLGFDHLGREVVVKNSSNVPVYLLMYATRNPLGVRLWDSCTKSSQLELFT